MMKRGGGRVPPPPPPARLERGMGAGVRALLCKPRPSTDARLVWAEPHAPQRIAARGGPGLSLPSLPHPSVHPIPSPPPHHPPPRRDPLLLLPGRRLLPVGSPRLRHRLPARGRQPARHRRLLRRLDGRRMVVLHPPRRPSCSRGAGRGWRRWGWWGRPALIGRLPGGVRGCGDRVGQQV